MAANKSVTVLVPNGRRQNIKVTPNTTILQILEDACQKHGFNANEYDVKHFNKVLDTNAIFRFTGLPNNAQLEMVPCTKSRKVSNVTIGIQLENGSRLIGEYQPDTALINILNDLCPDCDLNTAVLIYMQREVCRKEELEKTTLKTLGLTSGKAILRLINRDPNQEGYQAYVYVPLAKSNKDNNSKCDNGYANDSGSTTIEKETAPVSHHSRLLDSKETEDCAVSIDNEHQQQENSFLENANQVCTPEPTFQQASEENKTVPQTQPVETVNNAQTGYADNVLDICNISEENLKIEFLGARNALLFNQAGAQALPREELPDNFFDLTDNDARLLYRDMKRKREQLEEAPLLIEAQREFERNKRLLEQLHKYKRTVIRIQFPDQFVLQGLFEPLETVQTIKDFIKTYLDDPKSEFTVYTAPPKYVLDPASRLIDENLVPSAIIYYSGPSILSLAVKEKLTDPRAAGIQAVKSRMELTRKDEDNANKNVVAEAKNDNAVPGPSGSRFNCNKSITPKWFKLAK